MEYEKMRFDTCELLRLISERCSLVRFASSMKLSEERLVRLLFGIEDFSYEEMLLAAKLLHLSNEEFLHCFFTVLSSENLNSDSTRKAFTKSDNGNNFRIL